MHPVEDPAALLRQADAVLRSVQPRLMAHFYRNGWDYLARWDYPGVVRVFRRWDGTLIAQSRRGWPTKLAALRRARMRRPPA